MSILTQQGSEVRYREIDLSQTLIQESSANAAMVFVSNRGRPGLYHTTSPDVFQNEYGTRNAQISFGHYEAMDYFREGNSLYGYRVLGAGALYSAAILKDDSGATELEDTAGITDPDSVDWDDLIEAGDNAICVFTPKHGPGSYGDSVAVRISSTNLTAPQNIDVNSSATGGTLTAATYKYKVSAISATGESLASVEGTETIGSGTTNSITVSWDPVPGAIGYNIFGRAASNTFLAKVGGATYSYVDTGSVTPDGDVTPITDPEDLVITNEFTVEVFDLSTNTSVPVETYLVTLEESVGLDGVQQEIEQRINPFSEYVNVSSNVSALVEVPVITGTTAIVALAGGTSGAAPSNGDIVNAWETFKNKEESDVDVLINGGYTAVAVQQKMEEVARARATAIAFLDAPPTTQTAQQMIDYRNLTLNLNSSYAALFGPDVLEDDPDNGRALYVPFSGWAAALCARTDRVAFPWFSIAGLNRGLVNVLGVRYKFSEAEQTLLFKSQINYTRNFVGQGIALWEQTTLQAKASALSWISVRRLVNIIKKSTYKFLLYSLQEPNDDFLRRQVVGSIDEYLAVVKANRGISDYLVVSNKDNNPSQLYNAGILKVTVFITPIIPVHEIQVDMVITKQGVTFTEINISNI
jgi:hypothetical protein